MAARSAPSNTKPRAGTYPCLNRELLAISGLGHPRQDHVSPAPVVNYRLASGGCFSLGLLC
jgi:hypothetical protein